jgi:hypothetical protein
MGGDDCVADIQPQARAFQAAHAFPAEVALEHVRRFAPRQANTRIAHGHRGVILVYFESHLDLTTDR